MIMNTMTSTRGNLPQKPPFPRDSTFVENIRHFNLFMQNEPNLNICKINLTPFLLTTNDQRLTTCAAKNKPKQTQNKPILKGKTHPKNPHLNNSEAGYSTAKNESYFVPDGFFNGVEAGMGTPKSGVPSSFHLINCALGDLLWLHPYSGLSLAW